MNLPPAQSRLGLSLVIALLVTLASLHPALAQGGQRSGIVPRVESPASPGLAGEQSPLSCANLFGPVADQKGSRGSPLLKLILIGLLVFLLLRIFRRRSNRDKDRSDPRPQSPPVDRYQSAAAGWEHLRSKPAKKRLATEQAEEEPIPEDFDAQEFLQGAKAVYKRLQEAWDDRDLEDIRDFTTPAVFREIRRQAKADPNPGHTEITLLKANVQGYRHEDGQTHVSVLFEAELQGDQGEDREQVQEVWHFTRETAKADSLWLLEGLEQVEAKDH